MAVTGHARPTGAAVHSRPYVVVLVAWLAMGGCAASSGGMYDAGANGSGGSDGSGGSSGTGGSNNADASFDGSSPDGQGSGSGGAAQGSGGSSSSGGASASGGSVGTGGALGSGGSSGSGGNTGSAGGPGCMTRIDPVAPLTFTGIEAGPAATLRVRGIATYPTVSPLTWTWKVTSNTTLELIPTVTSGDGHSIAEFKIPRPDNFLIEATVNDPSCRPNPASHAATAVFARPGFIFRTTAAAFPVQEQRIDLGGGTTVRIDLQSGRSYMIKPLQAGLSSTLLRAYLRLTDPVANFSLEWDTTHGAVMANLLSGSVYNLLVVPEDSKVAPMLVRSKVPEELQGFTVDQGLHVSGLILDASGSPLPDARMILKNGELPSTVGVSDSMGQLDLWARAGAVSAIVVPPASSGLPQAQVDLSADGGGVIVPANTSAFSLTMKWAGVAHGPLTIGVQGTDGSTPITGARVRVSLRATNTPVGVLSARGGGGDVDLSALGSVDAEIVSDAAGQARFAALPVGTYDVTITPPATLAAAALTGVSVKLPTAGFSRTVMLAQKVNLTGKLGPLPASVGASVTATDRNSPASGNTAIAGSDGTFTLSVDPNRSYQLILQPRLGQALGRAVIANATVGAGATSLGSIALPASVSLTGSVMNAGRPIGDAFVQVFCVSATANCVDPALSLADVKTLSDGSFTVVLPDLTTSM